MPKGKGKKGVRSSAFRAVSNNTDQQITSARELTKVQYPVEQLDINNEYNPVTSTFTPRQNGIYSIIASILASPVAAQTFIELRIFVNGEPGVGVFENITGVLGSISVSTNLQLQVGDTVEVFVGGIPTPFFIESDPDFTHFEATRIG
ncbi:ABC transporter permease [Metabacillus herbersteinensis]|uniref:ABC transporter permease n=1 Tax=Metabacillus herbersteinensis TaxID=283816 RepID=A0ABV6GNF2_9BACI